MYKLLFFTAVAFLLTGCEKEIIRGGGDIITVTRDTDDFTSISVSGNAKIVITQAEEFKVELRGYANLLNHYSSRVENKVLKLGYRNNVNVRNDNIEIFVSMPEIKGVSVSGVADVDINGDFPHVPEFTTEISGSGEVNYNGTGTSDIFRLNISGSGDINAYGLVSKTVNVKVSGNGTGKVFATENLNVEISGNAKLYYKGDPEVNSNISGKGELIKQ